MLGKEVIMEELTVLDLAASSPAEVFERIAPKLETLGYVKPTFLVSIKQREKEYPTALPTQPTAIAIPHTMAEHILKPFVAPIRFKKPIPWREMSDPSIVHKVRLAFLLGFKDPGEHIELLQILISNCQRTEWIHRLLAAQDRDAFYQAVLSMEWAHD